MVLASEKIIFNPIEMKRFVFLLFISFLFFTTASVAQNNTKNFAVNGSVVLEDTGKAYHRVALSAGDSLAMQFVSTDGNRYYLLCDKNKADAFEKAIKHPKAAVRISGKLVDKGSAKYIVVESFMFL